MQGSGATVVIPRNKKRLTTGNIKQDRQGSGTTVVIPRNKKSFNGISC
jgi:hypothetical protein